MKLLKSYKKIGLFDVYNGSFIAITEDDSVIINDDKINKLIGKGFIHLKDGLISRISKQTLEVYNTETDTIDVYENLPVARSYAKIGEHDIILRDIVYGTNSSRLQRSYKDKIVWTYEYPTSNLNGWTEDHIFFGPTPGVFNALDIVTGEFIWTWDISERHKFKNFREIAPGRLRGQITPYDDLYLMPVDGPPFGGPYPLYALDQKTGEEVWSLNRHTSMIPVKYNGRLVLPTFQGIIEYDPLTGQLLRDDRGRLTDEESNKRKGLICRGRGCMSDDRLFFYRSKDFEIVIVDYHTLEILDTYNLEKSSPESWQIGPMQVSGGKIYIREWIGQSGTIHILEY